MGTQCLQTARTNTSLQGKRSVVGILVGFPFAGYFPGNTTVLVATTKRA